jgi:hypothetical protein
MSHTSGPTTNPSSSAADYDKTFGRALNDYKKLTGQDLNTHPFALNPNNFKSTDAVLKVLQAKVEAFDDVRDGNEMLMTWLGSYVSLLFTISSTLWESPETVSLIPLFSYSGTKPSILSRPRYRKQFVLLLLFSLK